jgi:hypothetical protein
VTDAQVRYARRRIFRSVVTTLSLVQWMHMTLPHAHEGNAGLITLGLVLIWLSVPSAAEMLWWQIDQLIGGQKRPPRDPPVAT